MRLRDELRLLVRISRTAGIARRYFVTNGFDGALTMLGLLVGLRVAGPVDLSTALRDKMVKNRAKYPAEEYRGRYRKEADE